eukprot:gene13512-13637_t
MIGKGSFKTVYRGRWRNTSVAIVRMRKGGMVTEARLMQQLSSHPNLVQFYRWSEDSQGNEYVVLELVSLGSLDRVLLHLQDLLRVHVMLSMCEQICAGMAELAQEGVLHRDLAARNVLVQSVDPVHVKVADFGLARVEQGSSPALLGSISVRWAAPEVLLRQEWSQASDVWAFGVTAWEIFSNGSEPYAAQSDKEVLEVVLSGQRLARPPRCPREMYALMLRCWASDPAERPTFDAILATFNINKHVEVLAQQGLVSAVLGCQQAPKADQPSRPFIVCGEPVVSSSAQLLAQPGAMQRKACLSAESYEDSWSMAREEEIDPDDISCASLGSPRGSLLNWSGREDDGTLQEQLCRANEVQLLSTAAAALAAGMSGEMVASAAAQGVKAQDLQKGSGYVEEATRMGAVQVLTKLLSQTRCEKVMDRISHIIRLCSGPMACGGKVCSFKYGHIQVAIREGALGDGLGAKVWSVCHIMCRELVAHPEITQDRVALELGSGTGLVGLVAALTGAQQVILSDHEPEVLVILRTCMHMNVPAVGAAAVPAGLGLEVQQRQLGYPSDFYQEGAVHGNGDAAVAAAAAPSTTASHNQQYIPSDAELFDDASSVDDLEMDLSALMVDEEAAAHKQDSWDDSSQQAAKAAAAASKLTAWDAGNISVRLLDWQESADALAAVRDQKVFDQFRDSCTQWGLRYRTVQVQPSMSEDLGGIKGRERDYEGGYLLMAVDHAAAPAQDWHRHDFVVVE